MTRALIGCTGFVGEALQRAGRFDARFHRPDIETMRGRHFDTVICAGLPAEKWRANREPAADLANMDRLCAVLREVTCDRFVLISTIDVYARPVGVTERDVPDPVAATAYGRHRGLFEQFVRDREGRGFGRVHVVRLSGLFGTGLRKNLVFDLVHRAPGLRVARGSRFQWYPIDRLAADLDRCVAAELDLVNLFPEPVDTGRLLRQVFPDLADRVPDADPASPVAQYDARTEHASHFGGSGAYVMTADAVLAELKRYAAAAAPVVHGA